MTSSSIRQDAKAQMHFEITDTLCQEIGFKEKLAVQMADAFIRGLQKRLNQDLDLVLGPHWKARNIRLSSTMQNGEGGAHE